MYAVFSPLARLPRRTLLAVVVVLGLSLSLATVVPSPAEGLDDRERRVQREIQQAQRELRHSSRALVRATARVAQAERRLAAAEDRLEARRVELSTAELVDAQMQSELEAANARLTRAEEALAQGLRSRAEQERALRSIATESYQTGTPGLMGLTLVLTSRDPLDLSTQLNVVDNVMDKEGATLQRLEASALLLELQQQRVADARADVAVRRRAAAETLAAKQAAEQRAAAASERVEQAVRARSRARAVALRAQRADVRRLNQLRRERDKISRLIRRQEAQLRRERSRASIARAIQASRARTGPMTRPVVGPVTSPYGMRLHPILRVWRLHDGTDFGAPCGTPVRAAAGGVVIGKYYDVGYGLRVIVRHGFLRGASVTTTYNHLSGYSTRVGERVRRGEVIAFAGTSGYSTGCHLHFSVFRNGRTTNPMNWLR